MLYMLADDFARCANCQRCEPMEAGEVMSFIIFYKVAGSVVLKFDAREINAQFMRAHLTSELFTSEIRISCAILIWTPRCL